MFAQSKPRTTLGSVVALAELIYHSTVYNLRKTHNNPVIGLFTNVLQTLILVVVFYFMMSVLQVRGGALLRGNFLLFVMSGIFLFMTFIKSISAVAGAEGPTSPMMKHAPMNTFVAILASALATLYIQVLSVIVVLFGYHVIVEPLVIYKPVGAFGMMLLCWFSGCAIGSVFLALTPWFPGPVNIVKQLFIRINMFASGKMVLANQLPGFLLMMFTWNPLFHIIDQARGFAFINYEPHRTSITYPLVVSCVFLVLGLMGEFYTRKHASASWGAKR